MNRRIKLFAKGNSDVRDPVFGVRFADGSAWGGIGDAFRELGWPVTAHVRHETAVGFFALTGSAPAIAPDLLERSGAFGALTPALQHSQAMFASAADAVILSIQPDVGAPLARHRRSGLRLALHNERLWPAHFAKWRREEFERLPPSEPDAAMDALTCVVKRLHAVQDVPVLVANLSAAVPGETLHAYLGVGETLSTRIRRFNLALLDFAQGADISVIDVDRIVAETGAEHLILGPTHYTLEGCRLIAHEVARILADRGVIEPC